MKLEIGHKQLTIFFVLMLLLSLSISVTAAWFLTKLPADKQFTDTDDEIAEPFAYDQLEFVYVFIASQGYLPPSEPVELSEGNEVQLTVVPTDLKLDFVEMITALESELWLQRQWTFQTEFREDYNTAAINISSDTSVCRLIVRQQTPATYQISGDKPKLAIVIDDWGSSMRYTDQFLKYPFPLTTAILPYLSKSYEAAEHAAASGHEVILHQPMEALNDYLVLGEGAITTAMSEAEIIEQLDTNIMLIPFIKGVNNHMGSRVTADYDIMATVLTTLDERELYFLDSSTTSMSVTDEVAPEIGIPYAINNHFIDNTNEIDAIKSEIRWIIERAVSKGEAIAIGHIREATGKALWEMIPEFIAAGVQLVPVSELLNYPGTTGDNLDVSDIW